MIAILLVLSEGARAAVETGTRTRALSWDSSGDHGPRGATRALKGRKLMKPKPTPRPAPVPKPEPAPALQPKGRKLMVPKPSPMPPRKLP